MNETVEKKNILSVILIIMLIIFIGLLIFLVITYKDIIFTKKDNKILTTTKLNKEEFDIDIANEILDNVFYNWEDEVMHFGIHILNDINYKVYSSIKHANSTDDYVYNAYDVKYDFNTRESYILLNNQKIYYEYGHLYKYNDVLRVFNDSFAQDDILKVQSHKQICEDVFYDNDKKVFITNSYKLDCGDATLILTDIYEAYKIDDDLYIDVVYAKVNYDEQPYIELNDKTKVSLDEFSPLLSSEILNKYKEKMMKYSLIFSLNNDKYRFIKMKKAS